MRYVTYKDKSGLLHRTLIPDGSGDEMAEYGVPADPPNIHDVDWDYLKREIHNQLVGRGLFTWQDVIGQSCDALQFASTLLKRQLVALFRQL